MCRVWSLILIICALTRISQTDPMEPGRGTGKAPSAGEEEKSKKSTTTGTSGDSTKPLLSTSGESTEVSSGAPKSETATLTEGFSFKTGVGGGYGKLTPEKDVKSKQPGGSTTPVTERPLLKEGGRPSEVTSGKPRKSGSVPSTAEGLPIKTGEGKGYGKLRPEKDETPKQPAGSTTPISQRPLLKEGGRPSKETSGKPQKPGSVPVTTEEFTFPRPGEGAGYTRLNEKLEKPKELSGSQRPLLGEETEPPTETTSEMPRRRAGKAPVKEDSPEPITASYEKLEQTKDGTAVCRLGIFYPSTEDGEITEKECEVHCKTHFGKIVSSPEDSIDITEPGIYKFADITLGQICRCTFNYNRLKDYITNRLSEKDFYDFLNLACDDGFCAARVWLKDKKLKVEIEYEMEAKKQNSPVTASTLVTPQMSTTNTPDRSRTQTPSRTPIQSPFQSPFQSPPRTPDRFSMQTSKYSGGVDKSKGVAKSSTGTAIAPGTPYRSPMRTAPGTPDRFFTGGDASTYTVRTPPEEVLVGAFTTADGSYTMDMCVDSCRTAFGNILSPESAYTMRMPFTKAKLTADGKTCNCVLRSIVPTFCYDKYIRYSVLVKKIKKHFFCAGKVYIESSTRPKTNIEIEYEQAARPPHKKNKDKKPHYVRVSVGLDEQHENQNPGFDGVGEPSIIMRTFDKGVWKKRITHDMCQQKCNEYFGYIYLNDTYKAHFTIGELNIDWSKCKCFVNVEPIKEKIDERLAGRKHKWIEFSEICKTKNGYFAVINFLITHEEYGLKIEPGNALTAEERQRLRQSKRRVDAEQKRALRMAVHRKEKRFFRPVQYKLGECEVYCNTRHGFVFGYPTRVPFTKPELSDDKYNCECWLNVKPLTYFFLVRNVDWDEFFKACEYSYERGVKFLRTGGIGVPPYVQEVREAKFPRIDVVDINGKVKILPGDPHPVGGGPSSSETPVPDVPSNPTVT